MPASTSFWITSALMALAVLAMLALPFLRRPRKALARAEYDLAIYKDQMRELEEDEAAGLISPQEAASARNEIARRILSADNARRKAAEALGEKGSGFERTAVMALALIAVPGMAYGLYLQKGHPGMPDMPIASRAQRVAAAPHHGLGAKDIAALVKKVEDRLAANPDDIQGWLSLAPVYSRRGQYAKAANAYRNILRLNANAGADIWNAYGEALVYAHDGALTPKAREAFSRALKLAPRNPMSRYFLAQADIQDGRNDRALSELKSLLRDLPKDFGGRALIEHQIAALEGKAPGAPGAEGTQEKAKEEKAKEEKATAEKAKKDQPASSPAPEKKEPKKQARQADRPASPAAAPAAGGNEDSGPTPEQVRERMKRMAGVDPKARREMIRNMVDGLEEKLEDNPQNLSGWLRLIKARVVLGEKDKAQKDYEKARAVFKGQKERVRSLDALAAHQGLKVSPEAAAKPLAPVAPPAASGERAPDGGPTPEQVRERMKRMEKMSPETRLKMIRNMVDGLEEKLEDDPKDLNGWLRLINARMTLGEKDKAKAAIEKAKKVFSDDEKITSAFDRLAKRLGL